MDSGGPKYLAKFLVHRTPNDLKNNYNQRLKKSHPDVLHADNKKRDKVKFYFMSF